MTQNNTNGEVEFDGDSAKLTALEITPIGLMHGDLFLQFGVNMARWQHSQDKAAMGVMKAEIEAYCSTRVEDLISLRAQLADAQREIERLKEFIFAQKVCQYVENWNNRYPEAESPTTIDEARKALGKES